jgi:RHS repeat-associated protein
MRARKFIAAATALLSGVGLTISAVVLTTGLGAGPSVPKQQAAGQALPPHRVSAAQTSGMVVDGHVVPAAGNPKASKNLTASGKPKIVVQSPVKSQHFPVKGKALPQQAHVLPASASPEMASLAGAQGQSSFSKKTSRKLRLDSPDKVVYANADGTRTAFEYQSAVNYRQPDGQWASISQVLVPASTVSVTPSGSTTPSAGASTEVPASASASASGDGASSPDPSASSLSTYVTLPAGSAPPSVSPSAGGTPTPTDPPSPTSGSGATAAPPASGWMQQSEAESESFASYADARDLVTMPLGAGQSVAFGVTGAAAVPGTADGSAISYPGVLPDAAINFTAGTGTLMEAIVLSSADAPTTWTFPLDLTGLTATMGPDGSVQYTDDAGSVVAYTPHGFMTDSDIDPHSGDGATSVGVDYSLTTVDGRQAIQMTLDQSWLDSPSRVFPVTVDPSTMKENSDSSTYVQSTDTNNNSGDDELHVGTWDDGTHKNEAYLSFGSVSTDLAHDHVIGAVLNVFETWAWSCEPRPLDVLPVTSAWSASTLDTWAGRPSTGAAVATRSFANGWNPLGGTGPCNPSGAWVTLPLNQSGTDLLNQWTQNTSSNHGLAIAASDNTDHYAWKKFWSDASGVSQPYLQVNYVPDGADYKLKSNKALAVVTPTQDGQFAITVTNTGSTTWDANNANGYEMSYNIYDSKGALLAKHPVFTALPKTIAPGDPPVTVDVTVGKEAYGKYAIDFSMYKSANTTSPVSFVSEDIDPLPIGLELVQPAPSIIGVYPPTGYISPVLNPQLSTVAANAGSASYTFDLTPMQTFRPDSSCVWEHQPPWGRLPSCPPAGTIEHSGSTPYWTPSASSMQWDTQYQWTVTVTTASGSATTLPALFTPEVPQPAITSDLGGTSGQAYDPLSGNYTTSATDAAVASAGPPLQIDRTYNSMDPRTSSSFGAGWSAVTDAALSSDADGGLVTVTMPSGRQVRFGKSGPAFSGYASPMGSRDELSPVTGGGWALRDPTQEYDFDSLGRLSAIIDQNGHKQSFAYVSGTSPHVSTITDVASGRTLTLGWSSASPSHVTSVTTQSPVTGQPGYAWTYNYSGDDLTSVCSPSPTGSGTACSSYTYQPGSRYLASVLDSGPRAYWQLGDSGGTVANDEVDVNLGTENGAYTNVTLGQPGPIAGSTATAAGFDGTDSSLAPPPDLLTDSTDVSVELWFKAANASASGVLFSYQADELSNASGNSDNHDPALYIGSNGKLYGELWNGSIDPMISASTVTDGQWHYAILTGNGSSQSLYLDGQQQGTALSGTIDPQNMTRDRVGAGFWGGWPSAPSATPIGYFHGSIGQVAVYPHALGSGAIASHYRLGTAASAALTEVDLPPTDADTTKVYEQATYNADTGRVRTYTDPSGGKWTINAPTFSGDRESGESLPQVLSSVTVNGPQQVRQTYEYDVYNGDRLAAFEDTTQSDSDSDTQPLPEVFGYDAAGFLSLVYDPAGDQVCFANDARGDVISRTWFPGSPAAFPGILLGTANDCSSATSSPNCVSTGSPCSTFYTYEYNSWNSSTAPDAQNARNAELAAVGDGRSSSGNDATYRTSYAYNDSGQLTSVTTPPTSGFPSGHTTSYVYSVGTESADGGGTIPANLLVSTTTPGGKATHYSYDSQGDLTQVTEPSGRYTTYVYDALGRPESSTVYTTSQPSGEKTTYVYNGLGNPLTVTHPGVANQVAGVTHTLADEYTYNADDDIKTLTEADTTGGDAPRETTYDYNVRNEVSSVARAVNGNADTSGTEDGAGTNYGATTASPQGAVTTYEYDSSGAISQVKDPNGNVDRYLYNYRDQPVQISLYTAPGASGTANCAAVASQYADGDVTQDADGGCDLTLDSYGYDDAGRLGYSADAMGRISNYQYDSNNDLIMTTQTQVCSSSSPCYLAPCTAAAPCTTSTVGLQTQASYDGAGNVTQRQVSAERGGTIGANSGIDYTYDADDQVTTELTGPVPDSGFSTIQAPERSVSFSYGVDGQVLSQALGTAAEGGTSVTNYAYADPNEDLTSQTVQNDSGPSRVTSWTYDQNGQPLTMTAPRGNVSGANAANYTTTYAYDPAGELAAVTAPPVATQTFGSQIPVTANPVTTYGYDTFGDQTQVQDPDHNVTTAGYDSLGRVVSATPPSYTPPGASASVTEPTTYAYDGDGHLIQQTDPAANTSTTYGYDALGDLTSVVRPQLAGESGQDGWAFTYDADGERLSATDPFAHETQATYDDFGSQVSATSTLNGTPETGFFDHDYLGDQTQSKSPDGVTSSSTYDSMGQLTSTADGLGNTTAYGYGYAGQELQAVNPDGSFTALAYSEAGDLTSATRYPGPGVGGVAVMPAQSETFGYDPDGNLTAATDWNGNTTTYGYNAADERTSQVVPVSASKSITTAYGYDPAGNQTAVTGGKGNTTWTAYNAWNLPESVVKPATTAAPNAAQRTWTEGYDADGRESTAAEPGGISLSFGYDPLGDLNSETGTGASAATQARSFVYDPDGNLTSASAPGGTDAFTYLENGELKTATGPSGASSFTYNGDGLVSAETTAAGTASYTYDSADRPATEADPLTGTTLTWAYNANSQPTALSYSSGGQAAAVQAYGYDDLDRLASDTVKSASGKVLAAETYGYDGDGNLTLQADSGLMANSSTTYGYDEADRLTSSVSAGTTTGYAYDDDGNLTQSGGTTYAYNAQDQVTSSTATAGSTAYGYGLSGALTSMTPPGGTAQAYTSDAYGDQASAPGGIGYAYDALGRLASRTVGSVTSSMAYAGTGSALASDGSTSYSYAPSGVLTASRASGGAGYAAMTDSHGDVAASFVPAAATTTLAGSASYSPYGARSVAGSMPAAGFQGDYTDPGTGQVDMSARWYSPAAGSFTAADMIGGSPVPAVMDGNPYAYGDGSPLTATDPTGHCDPVSCLDEGVDDLVNAGETAADYSYESLVTYAEPLADGLGVVFSPEIAVVGAATAGISALMWAYPESTASGCQDVICTAAGGGEFGDPQLVGGPALATVPGGPGGSPGPGCMGYCVPAAPPPPPPPPQDCYAGPAPTCVPPSEQTPAWESKYVTGAARNITDADQLFRDGRGITEQETGSQPKTVRGSQPSRVTNGNPATPADRDITQLTKPVDGIRTVPTPSADVPVTSAGTGSGGRAGSGGGKGPGTGVGAPVPGDDNGDGGPALNPAGRGKTVVEESGSCGGESFSASTRVLLPGGKTAPIASLKPGDEVLATNVKTGKTSPEKAAAVLVHHDTDLYDLTVKTSDGTAVIHTTANHLFRDPHLNKWVTASKLKKGEHLQTPDGTMATADGGTAPKAHDGWMWDLTVPGNNDHDFYVAAEATTVLVHNIDDEQCGLFDGGPYRAAGATPVQASLNIGDDSFAGTSLARGNPPIKGTFSFFVEHAEGDAFSQAVNSGADYSGKSGTLSVTQEPCRFCVSSISAVARSMGLSYLRIETPEGLFGEYTPETGLKRTP